MAHGVAVLSVGTLKKEEKGAIQPDHARYCVLNCAKNSITAHRNFHGNGVAKCYSGFSSRLV
jgi:hypothetical protein